MLFYFTKVLFEAITDKRDQAKFSCSMVIASMSISLPMVHFKQTSCVALPLDLLMISQKTNAGHAQRAERLDLT